MNKNKKFTLDEENKIREEAKERIRKHGLVDYSNLDDNIRILKTIVDIFKTEKKFNVDRNFNLLTNEFLNKKVLPKSANQQMLALIYCYKQKCISTDMNRKIGHPPKTLQILRDIGFNFRRDGTENYTFRENGKDCREITGFEDLEVDNLKHYFNITAKDQKILSKNRRDPLNSKNVGLQKDHRTPVAACKKLGITPAYLNKDTIVTFDKNFQFLSVETNTKKRDVCRECINNEAVIFIPDLIIPQCYYKLKWDELNEETQSCIGCFWHDYNYFKRLSITFSKYNPKIIAEAYRNMI